MTPVQSAAAAVKAALAQYGIDVSDEQADTVSRGALLAMREASEAMILAANEKSFEALEATYPDSDGHFADGGERLIWEAMLVAGINEGIDRD